MSSKIDLTKGPIFKKLITLALPIIGTSFFQMAYNLTDMYWIGRVGSDAVAAVGTAGFYTWFAMAFIMLTKIGAEVGVAQSVGKENFELMRDYIRHTIKLNLIMAVVYAIIVGILTKPLISFFNLKNLEVVSMAETYLRILLIGLPFYFVNPVLTSIFNGYGDSKTPFRINIVGLIANIVLDPLFIFVFKMGVAGAAIATILAQISVSMLFVYYSKEHPHLFENFSLKFKMKIDIVRHLLKLGMPVCIQSGSFTIIAMILARIITQWGAVPIAVQKVGSQIEALSWMTASGFATALGTFVGQNYGAQKPDRIKKAYKISISLMGGLGIIVTTLFVFWGGEIFQIFIPEKEAIIEGAIYMKILGYSQLFMCIEIATSGFFNGLGKTHIPSINSIVFTAMRIPMALMLSSTALELSGVWWSISITSVAKGIVMISLAGMLFYKARTNEEILKAVV